MNSASIKRNMFTSFLDLICCGLGAAILLFLLVVAIPADVISDESKCILVTGKVIDGPKAEIAIEFKGPNDTSWNRFGARVINFKSSSSGTVGGSAVCAIEDADLGLYQFQIVLVHLANSDSTKKTVVQMEASGLGIENIKSHPAELARPGKNTDIFSVRVETN